MKEKEKGVHFSSEIAPYSKSQEECFTFRATDEIVIESLRCDLEVKQGKGDEITVKLYKKVGDKNEELLEEELNRISCIMAENCLKLGYQVEKMSVNSCYAKAEILVPEALNQINCECTKGNVNIEGEYNNIYVNSQTGDVVLLIKKVSVDNKYVIDGKIGNVKITLPKKSKIRLIGTQSDNVKVAKDIQVEKEGPIVEINKTVSDIKIIS